jgi:hypothetical protein
MQRLSKEPGMAAADDGREKGFHFSETVRELRRKRPIIIEQPPVTFLPSIGLLTPKLFAKIFTNERMRIEMSRIMRIFSGEESCSS